VADSNQILADIPLRREVGTFYGVLGCDGCIIIIIIIIIIITSTRM
jgi:hypothetical protein